MIGQADTWFWLLDPDYHGINAPDGALGQPVTVPAGGSIYLGLRLFFASSLPDDAFLEPPVQGGVAAVQAFERARPGSGSAQLPVQALRTPTVGVGRRPPGRLAGRRETDSAPQIASFGVVPSPTSGSPARSATASQRPFSSRMRMSIQKSSEEQTPHPLILTVASAISSRAAGAVRSVAPHGCRRLPEPCSRDRSLGIGAVIEDGSGRVRLRVGYRFLLLGSACRAAAQAQQPDHAIVQQDGECAPTGGHRFGRTRWLGGRHEAGHDLPACLG